MIKGGDFSLLRERFPFLRSLYKEGGFSDVTGHLSRVYLR